MAHSFGQLTCFFLSLFALFACVAAAPHPWHAKRAIFNLKLEWKGHIFGSDRWGFVVDPPPNNQKAIDGTTNVQSAPNPPPEDTTTTPLVAPATTTRSIQLSFSTGVTQTANNFAGPRSRSSSSTRSSATVRPSSSNPRPSSTRRPTPTPTPEPSTQEPEPEPSSTPTTRRPTSDPKPTSSKPTSSPRPTNTTQPPPTTNSTVVSAADQRDYLDAHNNERALHGANPLQWSDKLSAAAQEWANNCVFQHSGGAVGPFGENLAAGSGTGFTIPALIKLWNDEAPDYNPNNPQPSHWTQVVWQSTTHVGCAKRQCAGILGGGTFLVCEYEPAGNFIGRFPENVQP